MSKAASPASNGASIIVSETLAAIDELRRLDDAFVETKVPVQDFEAGTLRYENRRVIRSGLLGRLGRRRNLDLARGIGEELAKHHDIQPLANDAGFNPAGASIEELAGLRFLNQLIDSVIAGRKAFPRNIDRRLNEHVKLFKLQLDERAVEVEWVYPILGGRMTGSGLSLAHGVVLQPMGSRDLAELYQYEVGFITGPAAPTLLLRTGALLAIRRVVQAPGGYAHTHQNAAILRNLAIATSMTGIRPFQFVTSWVRPVGPSVFSVGSAEWRLGSYGLIGPDRTIDQAERRILKRAFVEVQKCPESVLSSLVVQSLVSSTYRSGAIDILVDTWVGLEAILLTKDEKTELQYRMSLRAARLLDGRHPRKFVREFKKAYADRSKVIHGSSSDMGNAELTRLRWSQENLRKLVALAVKDGRLPDVIAVEDEMLLSRRGRRRI